MKKKTIGVLSATKEGLLIGDFMEMRTVTPLSVKTGAWVARMSYEKIENEWKPVEFTIMNATALNFPRTKWKDAETPLFTTNDIIAVRDFLSMKPVARDLERYGQWAEGAERALGKRDFAEFDNYVMFRIPTNQPGTLKAYPLQTFTGPYGDVLGIRVLLEGEEVHVEVGSEVTVLRDGETCSGQVLKVKGSTYPRELQLKKENGEVLDISEFWVIGGTNHDREK